MLNRKGSGRSCLFLVAYGWRAVFAWRKVKTYMDASAESSVGNKSGKSGKSGDTHNQVN